MAVAGSTPALGTPITHCKRPPIVPQLSGALLYTSSANQVPHRRNTLTIISKHVHRIRHHSATKHLTTLNAHIKPENPRIIGMTLTIGVRIRITKNRVSFINHIGINNELCHCNHLSLTRYPNHNTKHTTTRPTKHDTPERKKIDNSSGTTYTISNKTKSRQSSATQTSRHQRNQEKKTIPPEEKKTA